jgi:hypothetical protein
MIITPKQPKNDKTRSRLSKLVPYMLRGQGKERCTWYMAGNLPGLDRREDAGLAVCTSPEYFGQEGAFVKRRFMVLA